MVSVDPSQAGTDFTTTHIPVALSGTLPQEYVSRQEVCVSLIISTQEVRLLRPLNFVTVQTAQN